MPPIALFTLAFARPPHVTCLGGDTHLLVGSYSKRHAITHAPRRVPSALTAWTHAVSGSVSLPSPGYFSPFPHGTMRYRSCRVACLGPWSALLPTRCLVSGGTRDTSRSQHTGSVRDCHPLWYAVPGTSASSCCAADAHARASARLTTPLAQRVHAWHANGLGGSPFRSPLLRAVFRFLRVLRCFSSPTYLRRLTVPSLTLGGLPHSDTVGSQCDRHSPTLSLRICVLHRHDMPRHPPHAHHPLPGLLFARKKLR